VKNKTVPNEYKRAKESSITKSFISR
jgi:hypothetical protein